MTDMVDTTEHTSTAPRASGPVRPAADIASDVNGPHATRAARIRLLSVSLGTAGLGGAWQAAVTAFPPALQVSDALFIVSGLIWLVLLAQYLRHGGARWRNLRHDLRHPGDGFALGYVPIIGMLITGHFSRFELTGARWVYAVFLTLAAFIAARLLAHWLTGTLSATALHPGYLLPVSSAPFVASAVASTLRLPGVADAAFAVGLLYWLAFGTVILGGLVTGGPLPGPARPALTVLTIPPATGGIAWTAAHRGVFDAVGYGFAGTLLFTVLLVLFLLPELRQPAFHPGLWIYSFPVAASTNFAIRWIRASAPPGGPALTGILLAGATLALCLLATATLRHRARRVLPG
ncbi:SLAC1 family transporter [Streptomyces broussonetiae]|uniref:TDT family transporter n=1 Tax=Streptomyces broussonetiae TaxID=2686304 RepID=A0A6I6NBR0_9ACTN|nr:TDT family transporter [Streptomyces broussonetiae]QHA08854.1 TDT family transporter [Streptomyces broussonetiae]